MQINTSKTAHTTFSLINPVLQKDLDIRFRKESHKRDDLPRYLGVSLDARLCLRRQIEEVAKIVRERTNILQRLTGPNWGATPRSLRTIYIGFIGPVLERGRYLQTGEGAPLRSMVEAFARQRRRIKNASVLSVVHDLLTRHSMPTDRAQVHVPTRAPSLKPACRSDRWEERMKRDPRL
ncbi:RNA-directed DNA polymerase from mobile element jockey-like [Plakobranchus ocellatus]|uniref:RNA-directed DNA polymerase from mobile element jockey-like n=1 Tax=Plakobranchus ocellatus TaxID=259542 RepID=A0AAV3ZX77_9GAST|nr:RNA-directed DNA polymerase from mobile element jockey-like [Plakobranchus ocellatus]